MYAAAAVVEEITGRPHPLLAPPPEVDHRRELEVMAAGVAALDRLLAGEDTIEETIAALDRLSRPEPPRSRRGGAENTPTHRETAPAGRRAVDPLPCRR